MRLGLALGAAVIATTMVAYADSDNDRRFVFHRGEAVNADTNNDGFLSRDEASRDADRLFADLDRDNNGRITDEDHEMLAREVEAEVERAMEGVEIEMETLNLELEGLDEEIERSIVLIDEQNCHTTTEQHGGNRTVTTVCNSDDDDEAERARDHAERARERAERTRDRVDRRVHVFRNGADITVPPIPPMPPMPPMPVVAPMPPMPPMPVVAPMPPMPPMFWMGGGDNDESDLNGDGSLSREEFRAQQLRYFDARDANNDGRIRYEQPPEPPEPPQPPEPPRRR